MIENPQTSETLTRDLMELFRRPTFVETGTQWGGCVQQAAAMGFEQIYSVESLKQRHTTVSARFADYPSVHLFFGSSAWVLPEILKFVDAPALFWLDAHGGGHCPIRQELLAIRDRWIPGHTILIDDIRLFKQGRWDRDTSYEQLMAVARGFPGTVISFHNSQFAEQDIMAIHAGEGS
jgi:hypothetical protein